MSASIKSLVDDDHIIAASATRVPAPPHAELPGDHLFVNCRYDEWIANLKASEFLCTARADVLRIVRLLVEDGSLDATRSLSITFVGEWLEGRAERLYRYSLKEDGYPLKSADATDEFLFSSEFRREGSDLEEILRLL